MPPLPDDCRLADGSAPPSEFTPAEMDDLFDVLADRVAQIPAPLFEEFQ